MINRFSERINSSTITYLALVLSGIRLCLPLRPCLLLTEGICLHSLLLLQPFMRDYLLRDYLLRGYFLRVLVFTIVTLTSTITLAFQFQAASL